MPTLHHLLAITQEPGDPATRYRIDLHLPALRSRAVAVTVTPWPRGKKERGILLEGVPEFDSVVVQRRLLSLKDTATLRKRARRLAYDFDDAVIYRDSFRGYPVPLPDKLLRFRNMVSACDAVTAGNSYLADLAARMSRGCPVTIVPTVIDPERYEKEFRRESTGSSIGWIGQHTTVPYLEALRVPIQRLARNLPDLRLVTISDTHPRIDQVTTETIQWTMESEVRMLSKIDVGVAPLADNRWTKGKCGLRLLQFLACGIPAVASPVGTQAEVANRGACLPARSDSEWVTSITTLLNDQALRDGFIRAGKELIRERFVPSAWTDHLLSAWCATGNQSLPG